VLESGAQLSLSRGRTMVDKTAEERRRLSAAWLNIVAAGLVSAGLVHGLGQLAAEGWGERSARLLVLSAGYALAGLGFHLFARVLIPKPPPHESLPGGESS
jgi:hypothetical protein